MRAEIRNSLSVLIGQPFWDLGTAGLQWFAFGPRRVVPSHASGSSPREVGHFALHVQCPWRVESPGQMLAGSGDSSTDDFRALLPLVVRDVDADDLGGLTILLERGIRIDVFPDSTANCELWRFFKPYAGEDHLLLEGPGPRFVRDATRSHDALT